MMLLLAWLLDSGTTTLGEVASTRAQGSESQRDGRAIEERFLDPFEDGEQGTGGYAEGEVYDAMHSPEEFLALNPKLRGPVPEPLVSVRSPSVIVSLNGLTCHLFDADGTFERVYPVGVGVRERATRKSITPVGQFATHKDRKDPWFYTWERWVPDYFEGLPFLRLEAMNSRGEFTYGLHGPITSPLKRGYVSHGCVRMRGDDIREVFTFIYSHPGAKVTIQEQTEYDKFGLRYDVDYPLAQAPLHEDPPIQLASKSEVQVRVDMPQRARTGDPVNVSVALAGRDAHTVRWVLYNEGARWDANLSPPVQGDGYTLSHTFDTPGRRVLYAIALDDTQKPVACSSREIVVE